MTMTENDDKPVSPARELRRELIDDQVAFPMPWHDSFECFCWAIPN